MLTELAPLPAISSIANPNRSRWANGWLNRFLIRLRHWEYWPFAVVYFPVLVYYGWLAFKARYWFLF
jgi:hypothetical protein